MRSLWSQASQLAERTPARRNRYVDFLRAASIAVVVLGHWLLAAPTLEGETFSLGDMLRLAPWSQWMTWLFQVIPVFFFVGGFSNAASWERSRAENEEYSVWLERRLQRLVVPVVPLLLLWTVLALAARALGQSPEVIALASMLAFTPAWFLAVYVPVVVLVPLTHAAWRRFGMTWFWAMVAGAVLVDLLGVAGGLGWLRWANHLFVWLAVHNLGYLWRDGVLRGPVRTLACAAAGGAVLALLVGALGYPVSMITVPGADFSNSRPPTLALLALGALHAGLLLTAEAPMRRWLEGRRVWTWVLATQGSIMTLYLWHATVMVFAVGAAYALGGVGLRAEPASVAWWWLRVPWLATLVVGLAGVVLILGRLESGARARATRARPAWQRIAGVVGLCSGLAVLSRVGIPPSGVLAAGVLLLTLAGAALAAGPRLT